VRITIELQRRLQGVVIGEGVGGGAGRTTEGEAEEGGAKIIAQVIIMECNKQFINRRDTIKTRHFS
jgi:hypothetical protein